MIKYLITALVLYVLYIMFFRSKKDKIKGNPKSKDTQNSQNIESLVECDGCSTFISSDEAIISNGKYYCSNECIDK